MVFGVGIILITIALWALKSQGPQLVKIVASIILVVGFIAMLSGATRRLHDRGKSGWRLTIFIVAMLAIGQRAEIPETFALWLYLKPILFFIGFGIVVASLVELCAGQSQLGPNKYGSGQISLL
jgi:uncharacterized membrane protein YhaH (DUF805 family)